LLWTGAFVYAVYHIHNAWGFVILANLYWTAGCVVVNTVRLIFEGTPPQAPVRVRRVILEEVTTQEAVWPTALTR
jgi:hypothetical protein